MIAFEYFMSTDITGSSVGEKYSNCPVFLADLKAKYTPIMPSAASWVLILQDWVLILQAQVLTTSTQN